MTRTMTLPVPVGSLESYIQAVNRFPILSLEEERDLARKFRAENDVEAARQLVLSHLRLVVAIARGYMGYGLPQGDLIQEGNIGLMKAVKRFDPERGVRLVSFAVHWIRAEIHEFVLRNWRLVKVATTKAQRKLFFNLRSMKPSLAPLTQTEIGSMSKQLRVKPEEVAEMEMRLAGQEISLEPASDEDESYAPIAYLDPWRSPRRSRMKLFGRAVWRPRWRVSMRAAAASSRRAGCEKRTRQPCTNLPPSSRFLPSASARSNQRRLQK